MGRGPLMARFQRVVRFNTFFTRLKVKVGREESSPSVGDPPCPFSIAETLKTHVFFSLTRAENSRLRGLTSRQLCKTVHELQLRKGFFHVTRSSAPVSADISTRQPGSWKKINTHAHTHTRGPNAIINGKIYPIKSDFQWAGGCV